MVGEMDLWLVAIEELVPPALIHFTGGRRGLPLCWEIFYR